MTDQGVILLLVPLLAFAGVLIIVYNLLDVVSRRDRIRRRFAALPSDAPPPVFPSDWLARLDPARLGLNVAARRRLRTELVQAGHFDSRATTVYALARLALLAILPVLGFVVLGALLPDDRSAERLIAVLLIVGLAYMLPSYYLKRRQRLLRSRYQSVFPDYLDMLVVCTNAGLGIDAALDRAAREIGLEDREFRVNLELMAGEVRAGRGLSDALRDWAERVGLREAFSFASLLRQTLELGTDVALALTTFSDEMRDKRLARAEEKAAALPPKLTLPLGLCIFPVILIVILAPAVQRVFAALAPS